MTSVHPAYGTTCSGHSALNDSITDSWVCQFGNERSVSYAATHSWIPPSTK